MEGSGGEMSPDLFFASMSKLRYPGPLILTLDAGETPDEEITI